MKPFEVRDGLVGVLRLDLVGPEPGSPLDNELLPTPPSRWYLTGFLIPFEAPESQRTDETADDQLDLIPPENKAADDESTPETASARKAPFPSSTGLSFLLPSEANHLLATVTWGDYHAVKDGEAITGWQRHPRIEQVPISIVKKTGTLPAIEIPNSGGLKVVISIREVTGTEGGALLVPAGTRAVSVFVVNQRPPKPDLIRDEAMAFQVKVHIESESPLVPRPNLRGLGAEDWDEQVADLQYRDVAEFVVGHGVSAHCVVGENEACHHVETAWIPSAEVEKVEPAQTPGVELSMEELAKQTSASAIRGLLSALVSSYRDWIGKQTVPAEPQRAVVAQQLLQRAEFAAKRIEEGLALLDDPKVLDAFVTSNKVMAAAARRRFPNSVPRWRPFQLAFLLLNLRGIADQTAADREIVDLLFFPTGGGKTEAYLGLAAFTLLLRRLQNPGIYPGLSVLMRYTLRLLTLDQLGRAATLICALELERQTDVERLGKWPFEIGLWVGQAATPNKMGVRGDNDPNSARSRTIAYKNDSKGKPSPIPLENCPWCGTRFSPSSFTLQPNDANPTDLRIACVNRQCKFTGDNPLPILAVDEPIYRRLPCFLIATVDKFASLPWVGPVGGLFGRVERCDRAGFYGPCQPQMGNKLPGTLLPPDLIIQDELHLISGPLGTMVGLYETAIDALSCRTVGEQVIRPKVVVSTATVRRAETQIRALFARSSVEVFPCPGPDRRDSFFAQTVSSKVKNARRYIGIGAQGRSPKVILLRTYLALLAAAQKDYLAEGGDKSPGNAADAYMTLVGYFNSLRELGGCRRIVEDEVTSRLLAYGSRMRVGESQGSFANRKIHFEVVELTSRESTSKVAESKRRLAVSFPDKERVDVALATNMISVGLDIIRLGLMVVFGQPKTTAEYIQATSRVGRDDERPGLVVTLMNVHKPRDRSHYERFEAYHESFYRAVEATSVTPFSPRAIDRGIAAVTVGLARQGFGLITPSRQAVSIIQQQPNLAFVADTIVRRGERHARLTKQESDELRQKLRARVGDLLDEWRKIAETKQKFGSGLKYQEYEDGGDPHLLFDPLDPELAKQPPAARKFRAQRSLRDVEPNCNLWLKQLNGIELVDGDAE